MNGLQQKKIEVRNPPTSLPNLVPKPTRRCGIFRLSVSERDEQGVYVLPQTRASNEASLLMYGSCSYCPARHVHI